MELLDGAYSKHPLRALCYSFSVTQLVGDRAGLGSREATQDRWVPDHLGLGASSPTCWPRVFISSSNI